MSVVSVSEINDGRDGGDAAGGDGVSSDITRQFRVITDSVYDAADTVLQACDNIGVVHPTANWLYVKSRRAKSHDKSKKVWIATLKYSSMGVSAAGGPTFSPLASPADVTWNAEYTQENAYVDKDGKAILNSAGDYYEDGVQVDAARWVAHVTKNVPSVPTWIDSYRDAINSDNFWIDGRSVSPYTAKLSSISIGMWNIKNGIWFRQLSMSIKIKSSWRYSVLDQGLRRIVDTGEGDRREMCLNEDGSPVTRPALLDGSGEQLEDPGPTTAVFNSHYIYPELPFSALPIY